jgi:acyl-CoA hydrolase
MEKHEREVTLRFLAEPSDMNFLGKVFGGAVMKWIDLAGYTCAVAWSGQYSVTVYVGGIRFYEPIIIGHLVEVYAKLIYTGHTSMHIMVDVLAGDPRTHEVKKTTHCIIVFVAVDEAGKPVPVPPWEPQNEEDIALQQYALRLMKLRRGVEEEMSAHTRQ